MWPEEGRPIREWDVDRDPRREIRADGRGQGEFEWLMGTTGWDSFNDPANVKTVEVQGEFCFQHGGRGAGGWWQHPLRQRQCPDWR